MVGLNVASGGYENNRAIFRAEKSSLFVNENQKAFVLIVYSQRVSPRRTAGIHVRAFQFLEFMDRS